MSPEMTVFSEQVSQEMDVLLRLSDLVVCSAAEINDPYEELIRLEHEREKVLALLPRPTALNQNLQKHLIRFIELADLQTNFEIKRKILLSQNQDESVDNALDHLEKKRKEKIKKFNPPLLNPSEQKKLVNHLLFHAVNSYFDNILEKTKISLMTA
ncbi:hypothetical protein COW36_09795 [bacterium (Candidatus Blackallbacteria) CG17_big_fil_post_rev_8_21_14_2_50_48_46]|uniref:Uncharacterized protein n=1 Tax=bacterium (Candidatus Blackallbacteria) CG17_big_fil_post_rev_8_21_14_2_50_48_46 TaxID=2014261 RepID=A0A2M7G5K0_9BACT|nr:MAG: hypothetical protein COW64_01615 [bacterium (Candidatus Blackallbacteria) CG18_big_fil_WC_8_21_14_2_50_49_26]PIW17252.1 MAG: hypothetical protein COW36_09795 [bacterium (Candidatus Blackallbacteria) CG17_big_fil_post_rev_8_21_14_2_50_48_46]PIW51044.1 MAG: hypothetical protein COW20_00805 [bacterium (Candidatus Blackallbacteria) CG13_big_fil_rev_8_21_14_2_50_49_14]